MARYPLTLDLADLSQLLLLMQWLQKMGVSQNEYDPTTPVNPNQDYDFLGAFNAGIGRGSGGHMTDRFKLPYHPTFSTQSQYYKPGMPAVQPLFESGKWSYLPAGVDYNATKMRFQY